MTRVGESVPTPSVVAGIAAGRPVAAVWVNELGGVTFAIDDDGRFCGHVDLGVADRYADLAVADWSLRYNYEADWRSEFFDAYGVAPDQDRMDHQLRLWEEGA